MNTSMHDSLNLAWKLNLAVRGLAKPTLLATYEQERRKIAQDLINFDYEHANAFHDGDAKALARNFLTNVRFISGVGAEYDSNVLNLPHNTDGGVKPGCLLPPARLTRYIDANPVDAQLDIPMIGQFRIYFVCHDVLAAKPFLETLASHIGSSSSILGRSTSAAKASYSTKGAPPAESDTYEQPQRYTATSDLFTFALITSTPKADFEITNLPPLLQASRWTVYLDDVAHQDTKKQSCTEKWVGKVEKDQVAILNVRPDGYVGAVQCWSNSDNSSTAAKWLDDYYGGFLGA